MRKFTVVYEIFDKVEWGKTNPMKYEHNGVKAIAVRVGDALEELDQKERDIRNAKIRHVKSIWEW